MDAISTRVSMKGRDASRTSQTRRGCIVEITADKSNKTELAKTDLVFESALVSQLPLPCSLFGSASMHRRSLTSPYFASANLLHL